MSKKSRLECLEKAMNPTISNIIVYLPTYGSGTPSECLAAKERALSELGLKKWPRGATALYHYEVERDL